MTDDYKRGYGKGYQTGKRSADVAIAAARVEADESVARAERAEAAQGLGKCSDCKHWTREPGCMWGTCVVPQSRYHNREPLWFANNPTIATSCAFGCVLWAKRG